MALGWKEIESLTNRKRAIIRKWVERYKDFPLLRHPNGQPYLSEKRYEEWMEKNTNPAQSKKKHKK